MHTTRDYDSDEKLLFLSSKKSSPANNLGKFSIETALLVHALFVVLWIISAFYIASSESKSCHSSMWPKEFAPVEAAIEYHTVTFDVGNASVRNDPVRPYRGPPTFEKDVAWWHLYDVGMVVLSPEQALELEKPTQPISSPDPRPLIQLDVFHQLHCLDSIRKTAYGDNPWDPNTLPEQKHLDHCFEYLRQVLMCHADVTPITHKPRVIYSHGKAEWIPDFAVTHTCRDFQKIHDWAKAQNTSAYVISLYPGLGVPSSPD